MLVFQRYLEDQRTIYGREISSRYNNLNNLNAIKGYHHLLWGGIFSERCQENLKGFIKLTINTLNDMITPVMSHIQTLTKKLTQMYDAVNCKS